MNLRYYLHDAPFENATQVMKRLGITYKEAIPQSLGDQWWFIGCENVPEKLPEYIEPMMREG